MINVRFSNTYVPSARWKMMQEQNQDKGSEQYQRIAWEALKNHIVGATNKVNVSNIKEIVPQLFQENIVRGRGVLARAIMQAQAASPTFTHVYAALVAIINSKCPEIGKLILKRVIIQYHLGISRNDKKVCLAAARFLAHLLNQEVTHEILLLEILLHLLENATKNSMYLEVAIAVLRESGKKLQELSPKGMMAITQRIRDVLHEGNMDVRIKYMVEVFFAIQKDNYKEFPSVAADLDLVEDEDKNTHLINLQDSMDGEEILNVFKFDCNYIHNEEKYKSLIKGILGCSNKESSDEDEDLEDEQTKRADIKRSVTDLTEIEENSLRRKIFLLFKSSLTIDETCHKLLALKMNSRQIAEMCYMILDGCSQTKTYEKFYCLLAERFCQLSRNYVKPFSQMFSKTYDTVHRLEANQIRNTAMFFAYLLYTDAISWEVLAILKMTEEDTTSSSRIFVKTLFQELSNMSANKLKERMKDPTLQWAFEGLFPRGDLRSTRFAVNFFTAIGLGCLTHELRQHLKTPSKTGE